ncbi:MAG: carbohydrate ABC transporter permease [Bacilli bacterium]
MEQKQYTTFENQSFNDNIILSIGEKRRTVEAIQRASKIRHIIGTTIVYILILFAAFTIIFPFYWMIITSLKYNDEITASTQTFFPSIVMWTNYIYVFDSFDFSNYMFNTIVVGIFSTAGTILTTIAAAFAFARLKFKGRDALFAIFLMTMMIPGEMMVISNYITVASFGWIGEGQTRIDAYLAMIVPFAVSVFYIYLLRQNFKQIPNELYLATKVDGKTDWTFLWKVMVPLAAPTIISIVILKFMGTWNAYVWPNLITDTSEFRLISNGLRGSSFTDLEGRVQYGYQMAATVLVTVPLFLLFIFFRKYIMRGFGRAGIKG